MFDRLRRAWGRRAGGSLPHLATAALDDGVDTLAPRIPVATLRDDLIACEECDALHRRSRVDGAGEETDDLLPSGRHYECRRCGAPLGLERHGGFELPLSLAMAGLVVFAIAQLNPVMAIDIQGQVRATTLWEAAWTLYDDGAWLLCGTVLFTTLVNPLVELAAVCYVLLPLRSGEPAPGAGLVLRAMRAVRPWVMIEVFMLGALVAFTKLSAMARVTPGVGLWSFGVLMLLVAASASTFDHEHVWASMAAARRDDAARRAALRRHLADL